MAHRSTKRVIKSRMGSTKLQHRRRKFRKPLSYRLKRARSHKHRKPSGARISRGRLRMLEQHLSAVRQRVSEVFYRYWVIPEHDIRETLAQTQRAIDRAVDLLPRTA